MFHIPHIYRRYLLAATLLLAAALSVHAQKEYYFRNVETGQWLGPGNAWGTQASLLPHPYWNRLKRGSSTGTYETSTVLPNGTYVLESQVDNGSDQIYLGGGDDNNPYMDTNAPWTLNITRGADGLYTIQKDGGSNYGAVGTGGLMVPYGQNTEFKWRIRSYDQMVEAMKLATTTSPIDATFLILDPNFSHNNANADAWTFTASNKNISGGKVENKCAESYHSEFTLSQTITGVPNGTYRLTAQGFYRDDKAAATATFPFDEGTVGQTATYSNAPWFGSSGVTLGNNLGITQASNGQTLIEPSEKVQTYDKAAKADANTIYFWFTPIDGNTFQPSTISFLTTRYGTNGGLLDISWLGSDGTEIPLDTEVQPARNNASPNVTYYSANIPGATACNGVCGVKIVLYNLDPNKQVGFGDVVVTGQMSLATKPQFFLNSQTAQFLPISGTENSMSDASASFLAGNYTISPIEVAVTDNTINLGARLTDNTTLWCIWDNFSLEYLGNGGSSEFGTVGAIDSPAIGAANGDKFYVEYVGNDVAERWLTSGSNYGARATLQTHPEYILLKNTGTDTYTIQSPLTSNNYLGGNSIGDITDPYLDVASAINLTLVDAGEADTYYVHSGDIYYTRSAAKDNWGFYTMEGNNGSKWEIFSREQMLKMMATGTETVPQDATWLIGDHNFGRNNRDANKWVVTDYTNFTLSDSKEGNGSGANHYYENNCAESYHSSFTLTQTISGVPNGIYELRAQGFYQGSGNVPYIYIRNGSSAGDLERQSNFNASDGTENNMYTAAQSFYAGKYPIPPIRISVTDGTLTVGAKLENNTGIWAIWDNFEMKYMGNPIEGNLDGKKYYIRNKATGKWFGPGNNAGTQASLIPHAQYVILHLQDDGTYTMETQLSNGGSNYYFNGAYMDGAAVRLSIVPTGTPNTYSISQGDSYFGYDSANPNIVSSGVAYGENTEWEILTYDQMIEEMLTGTDVSPKDATFLIHDPNFDRNHRLRSDWIDGFAGQGYNLSYPGGADSNMAAGSLNTPFLLVQNLLNIPNGKYRLRAQAVYEERQDHGDTDYTPIIFAGEISKYKYFIYKANENSNMSAASGWFSANPSNYRTDWINVEVTAEVLQIGAYLSDRFEVWAIWDNFELEYLGPLDAGTPTSTAVNADVSTQTLTVLPRQSFLADRANTLHSAGIDFPTGFLQAGEGWKANQYGQQIPSNGSNVQNISEYTTIHYVKQGEWSPVFLTNNNGLTQSHHDFYQRWYYYNEGEAGNQQRPLGINMMAPQKYAYYYSNGLVMGTQLMNGNDKSINLNGSTQPITIGVQLKLPVGMDHLTVGGDVTRYSDLSYANPAATTAGEAGNLTEPSLSVRYIYQLKDAKQMADKLTTLTGDTYYETHEIHFPARTIGLTNDHVPLDLELRDYWFYRDGIASYDPDNAADVTARNSQLQNISGDDFFRIEVSYPDGVDLGFNSFWMIQAPNTDRGASDIADQYPITNTQILRRRLVNFSYPAGGSVPGGSKMLIKVKAHNPELNEDYNLALFTVVFDSDSETLPYTDIVGEEAVKKERSGESLRELTGGDPVAHIDFDFPKGETFRAPGGKSFFHGLKDVATGFEGPTGSALPFSFENSNYSFATLSATDMWLTQWGDYSIGFETYNPYDEQKKVYPASRYTEDMLDEGLQSGFLFIDASDLPGTVATIPFVGNFCQGSRMMCTGWMASRTNSSPGSVILKVIGIDASDNETEIYAFCPGQVGLSYRNYGASNVVANTGSDYVWQQFYFTFSLKENYANYVLRVENNCESTMGGDYMLDDIWVWVQTPTLEAERTSPLCGGGLDVVELSVDYDMLLSKTNTDEETNEANSGTTSYMTFVYLDWDQFLTDFRTGLQNNTYGTYPETYGIGDFYSVAKADLTLDDMSSLMRKGVFAITDYDDLYKETFLNNLIRFDDDPTPSNGNDDRSYAYANFLWSNKYSEHDVYIDLTTMTTDPTKVYRTGEGDARKLMFNGSFKNSSGDAIASFGFYHNYALLAVMGNTTEVDVNAILTGSDASAKADLLEAFDVRTQCSSRSLLMFKPKMEILGTVGAMSIDEVEFCKNTDITFAMELTGIAQRATEYNGETVEAGDDVVIRNAYFDWWLGRSGQAATVENYNAETTGTGEDVIYLKDALRRFRLVYPQAADIFASDIVPGVNNNYEDEPLDQDMIDYLRSLAAPSDGSDPQLIIHQKVVEIHASEDKVITEDGKEYIYFVAIPIEENVNAVATDYIYACAEPLPFRVLVHERAPSVREGFSDLHYPATLGTLSIRIAKSQFEQVRDYDGSGHTITGADHTLLHIPLRNVSVYTPNAIGVEGLSSDAGKLVRLADTDDNVMQQVIASETRNLIPPAVGTVDHFLALKDAFYVGADKTYANRLAKIHFSKDFKVREGYSYTLRMYFQEAFNSETHAYAVASDYLPAQDAATTITNAIVDETADPDEVLLSLTYGNDGKWDRKMSQLNDDMSYYLIGGNNPKDDSGTGYRPTDTTKRLPTKGTFYKIEPKADGVVKAGIVLNANKPLYVTDDAGNPLNDPNTTNDVIVTDQAGIVKYLDMSYQLSEKLTGFVQFPVEAGKTYYLFTAGSKLGFYGLYFNKTGFPMTCEGTMDVIMKIVPDYEVWTGRAGNDDWNNDDNWRRADYDELYADNGTTLRNTAGNTQYLPNGDPATVGNDVTNDYNFITKADRQRKQGFAPLYCTNILMMTKENVPAPVLYNEGPETWDDGGTVKPTGFPNMHSTASSLIRYDFQARQMTTAVAGEYAIGDMKTELYGSNVCNYIAFQPETELVNSHHLNYTKAWVEYGVDKNRWHLLGSPLKNTLSAEWYAPTFSARQETTYFEPIWFDKRPVATVSVDNTDASTLNSDGSTHYSSYKLGYDRFSPAVYQRSWDKAKAVLYERGATWDDNDNNQDVAATDLGEAGQWVQEGSGNERSYRWDTDGKNADEYLTRLTYQPMGVSKANVAVKGTWSGVYNDHTEPYDGSGFSVMPINNLKENNNYENTKAVFRLPKDDQYYDVWDWGQSYSVTERTRVYIKEEKYGASGVYLPWETGASWNTTDSIKTDGTNTLTIGPRGRMRTDDFTVAAPDTTYTVTLKNEGQGGVGFFLVANPFVCGLDMAKFFAANNNASTGVEPYYLVLHDEDIAPGDDSSVKTAAGISTWTWTDMSFRGADDGDLATPMAGKGVVPARYAFFVKAKNATANELTLTFTPDMQAPGREGTTLRTPGVYDAPQRHNAPAATYSDDTTSSNSTSLFTIRAERDGLSSEATVELADGHSNQFLQGEDMETFVVDGITADIPVVYTLCGRLATSINRLHDFSSLPVGIESNSTDVAAITFSGVENLGHNPQLYDAYLQTLTPLTDDSRLYLPGSTQNRYFIVTGDIETAVAESNIMIQPLAGGVRILSTTGEPLTRVSVYDTSGRLIHSGSPLVTDYTIDLPNGIAIVKASTGKCTNTKKILIK